MSLQQIKKSRKRGTKTNKKGSKAQKSSNTVLKAETEGQNVRCLLVLRPSGRDGMCIFQTMPVRS